jgi:hypothetical protein
MLMLSWWAICPSSFYPTAGYSTRTAGQAGMRMVFVLNGVVLV